MSKKHRLLLSFEYAKDGVTEAFGKEPNFRIHVFVAIFALVMAFILKFSAVEWAILVITITMVVILELINTAIEAVVDLESPEIHPKAKVAKDVSAAAVLISALASVLVGFLLFLPKIIDRLNL